MSEKQIKKLLKFSKEIIHPAWRPLLVGDEDSLGFIGTENLQLMLEDWRVLLKASEVAKKATKKLKASCCSTSFYERTIANASRAIPILERLIFDSESKPIFCPHRPIDYFKLGDKVFICMGDDMTETVKPFVPAVITEDEECGELGFRVGEGKNAFTAYIEVRSPYILSEADARYLSANSDYLLLFSRMGDMDGVGEMDAYEDLVLECGIKYFPECSPVVSSASPGIYFASSLSNGGAIE